MVFIKSKSDYVDAPPAAAGDDGTPFNFKPLPKYGHLSEKTPEFVAVERDIAAMYDVLWVQCPDLPTFRAAAGNRDAPMPPGAPDRYAAVRTEFLTFAARDGQEVELKVYKSPHVAPEATLVYRMHGGGFCVGNHETDGAENVYAATNPDIVVVSVDYRLAPEHPFPKAVEDSYDGLIWCKQNAKTLGINPEKIILAGSSAGGKLAAVLALLARDNNISGIVAQILHFPTVCHPKYFPRDGSHEFGSYVQNADNVVLSDVRFEVFLDAYMPPSTLVDDSDGEDEETEDDDQKNENSKKGRRKKWRRRDIRHSPLLADSLAGLPPTLIQAAGVDILRDEAFAYAEALRASGSSSTPSSIDVDVEMYAYAGVPHCFPAVIPTHPHTALFYERFNAFLRRHASSGSSSSSSSSYSLSA